MFKIFRSTRVSIDSLTIPTFNWNLAQDSEIIKQWINNEQSMSLSINFFDAKPDIPSLHNISLLRDYYRKSIGEHGGGLIETELIEICNIPTIRNIFKIPRKDTGIVYLSSLTIPMKKFSFVVKLQAQELGLTGMREAMISDKLLKSGEMVIGKNGFKDWSNDPYDKDFRKGSLMNKSEDKIYDKEFPDHPLTQSRNIINNIQLHLKLDDEVVKSKKH